MHDPPILRPMTALTNIFDPDGLERLRKEHRLDPELVRRLRIDLLKKFGGDQDVLKSFPAAEHLQLHFLELFKRCDSSIDGASKLLFRTASGMLIESVILRIATGRTTLCVSSQVGCAAACDFCATGKMGIAQNLSVAEILDQVLQAGQMLAEEDRRLNNIVFMGMGEPFHNEDALHQVVEQLLSPQGFYRPASGILVSTVGVPDAMLRFAKAFPSVNLALSLHSADQKARANIIPLARKHQLEELRSVVSQINQIQQRELMIEYLMLKDVNDTAEAANQLLCWLDGLKAHINLIPFNPIDDSPHLVGSDRSKIDEFSRMLKAAGQKTTVRYSLGSDIAAACGQLVRKENREHAIAVHQLNVE